MNSPGGLVVLERARMLYADLVELKKESPDDAVAIASFILANFGSIAGYLTLDKK